MTRCLINTNITFYTFNVSVHILNVLNIYKIKLKR